MSPGLLLHLAHTAALLIMLVKGLILRLMVFDYLGGSNYLNPFGLIRRDGCLNHLFTNKYNQDYLDLTFMTDNGQEVNFQQSL